MQKQQQKQKGTRVSTSAQENKNINVFTYGSLMYPEVIENLLKHSYSKSKAVLKDHCRFQVKGQVYPGILRKQGKQVKGVVYFSISQEHLKILDFFESVEYQQINVQVQTEENSLVKALAYLYKHQQNLEPNDWNIQEFEQKHKHSFGKVRTQVIQEKYCQE